MRKYKYAFVILLVILIALNIPFLERFIIANGKSNKIVYIDEIDNAKEFVVTFKHSVNRTPVNEFIKIKDDKFIVYKTSFYSYGAGMPELDPGSGQTITINDGLIQIDNINRELKNFTYIVGTYAEHTLSYNGKSMKLSEYIEPQNPAFFTIKKITLLELIIYKLIRI